MSSFIPPRNSASRRVLLLSVSLVAGVLVSVCIAYWLAHSAVDAGLPLSLESPLELGSKIQKDNFSGYDRASSNMVYSVPAKMLHRVRAHAVARADEAPLVNLDVFPDESCRALYPEWLTLRTFNSVVFGSRESVRATFDFCVLGKPGTFLKESGREGYWVQGDSFVPESWTASAIIYYEDHKGKRRAIKGVATRICPDDPEEHCAGAVQISEGFGDDIFLIRSPFSNRYMLKFHYGRPPLHRANQDYDLEEYYLLPEESSEDTFRRTTDWYAEGYQAM